jgi:hypothetical protein
MIDQFTIAAEVVGVTVKRFSGLAEIIPYLHKATRGDILKESALLPDPRAAAHLLGIAHDAG